MSTEPTGFTKQKISTEPFSKTEKEGKKTKKQLKSTEAKKVS